MSPCKDLSLFEPCMLQPGSTSQAAGGELCPLFLLVLEPEKMSWPRGAAHSTPNVIAALCNQVTVWLSLCFW